MELWIPLTIMAAFSQNIRSALQKNLTSTLSTAGVTQARFFYAIPFALFYVGVLCIKFEYTLPNPNAVFFASIVIGGLSQIIATALLVTLFSYRNFFIGAAYSKTEAIQAAILGLVILVDPLSLGALAGICMGLVGIFIISLSQNKYTAWAALKDTGSKPALIGMSAGLFFGVSAVCYRAASLSLDGGFVIQAAFTLVTVLIFQTLIVFIYLAVKERGQITALLCNWKKAYLVGLCGMIASVGWFTAMTLENAAHVRALGQIELVFAFLASTLFFKEQVNKIELLGVFIIMSGISILLLCR